MDLDGYSEEFGQSANRSVSLLIAGAIVWLAVGLLSTQLSERMGNSLSKSLESFVDE